MRRRERWKEEMRERERNKWMMERKERKKKRNYMCQYGWRWKNNKTNDKADEELLYKRNDSGIKREGK